ncbi:hypothetical protein PHRODO_110 [Bacillus phage Phrodo]|uniref:hypothetical protein n=1 Tax=Bacillus phage Phrodo TaxID=1805953 RepID=UPI0007A77199|nr:hypothetical protein BI003_gp110 [Bacillus phage Phrodo]AMW62151.1 hypothetical protein PHRODO_110 [Bacillus phage Phrodo]UGO48921.1 hypothetical protein JARJAR_107 [Bacillus phage vB_BanH_JarJar]UGO50412.1 hypothetical protein RONSWANSON_106 [Bacillus phage vB_BanH_RonSwanson]
MYAEDVVEKVQELLEKAIKYSDETYDVNEHNYLEGQVTAYRTILDFCKGGN